MDRKAVSSCDESNDIVTWERITALGKFKVKVVDIIEDEAPVEGDEESFACPKCGYPLKVGMTECPNCHVGISFEEVEEENEE